MATKMLDTISELFWFAILFMIVISIGQGPSWDYEVLRASLAMLMGALFLAKYVAKLPPIIRKLLILPHPAIIIATGIVAHNYAFVVIGVVLSIIYLLIYRILQQRKNIPA